MENKTINHISATVIEDTVPMFGDRTVSVELVLPRIILAELNTHRMLVKNTASSRAIPAKRMVESVVRDPFIPIAWQRDHSGMQGTEYLTAPTDVAFANDIWLEARDKAVKPAKALNKQLTDGKGFITKQLSNRLLEPFMWVKAVVTGQMNDLSWLNFFNLRCPQYLYDFEDKPIYFKSKKDYINYYNESQGYKKGDVRFLEDFHVSDVDWRNSNKGQAEIHIMDLAEKIYDAINESTPRKLEPGQYHIPYFTRLDNITDFISNELPKEYIEIKKVQVSVALVARASYTTIEQGDEILNYPKLFDRYESLITSKPIHASPLDHAGKSMTEMEYYSYIRGAIEYHRRGNISNPNGVIFDTVMVPEDNIGWCRQYRGYRPYRDILEDYFNDESKNNK